MKQQDNECVEIEKGNRQNKDYVIKNTIKKKRKDKYFDTDLVKEDQFKKQFLPGIDVYIAHKIK